MTHLNFFFCFLLFIYPNNFPRNSGRPGMSSEDTSGMSWCPLPPTRAVLFWSRLTTGSEDMASIHAAEAITEGEKWIMTRWMREIE